MVQQDIELVQRIIDGDCSAENELFIRFGDRIETTVRLRIGVHNEHWKDVTSEVKSTVLHKFREGKFDPQKGELAFYIHGITVNKIKEYYRAQKKDKAIFRNSSPEDIEPAAEYESKIEDDELKNLMRGLIKSLNVKYQEVIYLKFYEDLSVSQIADKLDLAPRRVSERIHYALKIIQKKCLGDKNFSILREYLSIYL